MKKILAMLLSVAIIATIAIGGTVAYLSDDDGAVNVMSVGNVFITQYEQERVMKDGEYVMENDNAKLQSFANGQQIVPAVYGNQAKMDMTVNGYAFKMRTEAKSAENSIRNYVDKIVSVENTGTAGAYVRTIIAIPTAGYNTTDNAGENWLHWNGLSEKDTTPNNGWIWYSKEKYESEVWKSAPDGADADEGWPGNTNNWNVFRGANIKVDGVTNEYDIYVATNKNVIKAGEKTAPNLVGFYIDKRVDNEKKADGTIDYIFKQGDKTYHLGDISKLNILVMTQAVQAEGFDNAWDALDEAFGTISKEDHPWKDYNFGTPDFETGAPDGVKVMNLKNDVTVTNTTFFADQAATSPYTINGNGKTVTMFVTDEVNDDTDLHITLASESGAKATLNNVTIKGTMQSVELGHYRTVAEGQNIHNTELNNVNIVGTDLISSYTVGINPAVMIYGKATLNNCNIYGNTRSRLDTLNHEIYDVAIGNATDVKIKGGKIGSIYTWNQAKVMLNDVEVDSITPRGDMNPSETLGITIGAGTTVNTIDLSNIENKTRFNITVAEGGTVNNIVAKGVSYDSFEAWRAA